MLAWTAASLGRHCSFDAKEVDHDQVEFLRCNPYVAVFDGEKIGWVEGTGYPQVFVESEDETVDVRIATRVTRQRLKDRVLYPSETSGRSVRRCLRQSSAMFN
jgi:hypothetical protein